MEESGYTLYVEIYVSNKTNSDKSLVTSDVTVTLLDTYNDEDPSSNMNGVIAAAKKKVWNIYINDELQ